ncbi:MAG: hypothetical protein ABI553_07970 [Chloroflexota bacterium]
MEVTMATHIAVKVRHWKAIVATAGVIALTSGCAATTATSSSVAAATATPSSTIAITPPPSPSPTATPAPTAKPTPLPPAKALCASGDGVFPMVTCQLAAGTYSTAPLVPVFRFTVGAGWENDLAGINAGQLTKKSKTSVTGFGWGTGMKARDGTDIGKSIDAMLQFLAAQSGATMAAPVSVTIGGVIGRSVDITLNNSTIFFRVGKSGASFNPGEKLRMLLLEVNGAVVFISIEVTEATTFDKELVAVQPILDSILWQ